MDFGDYQQNYAQLHQRILEARHFGKPVVNAEYAYWLRDANSDGRVDKANSYGLTEIGAATWDIVMAGGYVVTGFGSSYLGGARHRTTFLPDDHANEPWIEQVGMIKNIFESLEYWTLEPRDECLSSSEPRGEGEVAPGENGGVESGVTKAPDTAYWCLANPGKLYVVYVRGVTEPVVLSDEGLAQRSWRIDGFDPRTGARQLIDVAPEGASLLRLTAPDTRDWVFIARPAG